jgi:hypothetical protein
LRGDRVYAPHGSVNSVSNRETDPQQRDPRPTMGSTDVWSHLRQPAPSLATVQDGPTFSLRTEVVRPSVLDRQSGGSSERRPQVPRGAQHGPAGDLDRLPGQGQQPGAERRPAEVVLVPQPRRELRCGRESVGRREHAHRAGSQLFPRQGVLERLVTRARRGHDLVSGGVNHVPVPAEGVDALAVRVAGLLVAGERVERVPVVGDLRLSVGPHRRRDQ